MTKPIPYRGADYSALDKPFMEWWRINAPTMRFGAARDEYDRLQAAVVDSNKENES